MRIALDPSVIERARGGDLAALEALLRAIQRPVYTLAVRMLGQRTDAEDATQEILLKVTTHLGAWRGEGGFGTWVHSVAANHLLNTRTRGPGRRELSFEVLSAGLDRGLAMAEAAQPQALSPEDRLEARRTALTCTQAMLLCLAPPARLAYVLDVIFGLDSAEAAEVQGISPAAHRQRLSRARTELHGFMQRRCGLVNAEAACRCERQVPAKRAAGPVPGALAVSDAELDAAEAGLRDLITLGDAAAVMRGAPEYLPPAALLERIRLVVQQAPLLRN